jgi:hypothetical protein
MNIPKLATSRRRPAADLMTVLEFAIQKREDACSNRIPLRSTTFPQRSGRTFEFRGDTDRAHNMHTQILRRDTSPHGIRTIRDLHQSKSTRRSINTDTPAQLPPKGVESRSMKWQTEVSQNRLMMSEETLQIMSKAITCPKCCQLLVRCTALTSTRDDEKP